MERTLNIPIRSDWHGRQPHTLVRTDPAAFVTLALVASIVRVERAERWVDHGTMNRELCLAALTFSSAPLRRWQDRIFWIASAVHQALAQRGRCRSIDVFLPDETPIKVIVLLWELKKSLVIMLPPPDRPPRKHIIPHPAYAWYKVSLPDNRRLSQFVDALERHHPTARRVAK